jgi:hypothetical protein
MWRKEILSYWPLPVLLFSIFRREWHKYQEIRSPIARFRDAGAL